MASDPFEDEEVLARTFFNPGSHEPAPTQRDPQRNGAARHNTSSSSSKGKGKPKPTHYKVVSISLYMDDIDRIDALVKELKRRGFTKMNRSALIRFAIDTVDLDKLPRQY